MTREVLAWTGAANTAPLMQHAHDCDQLHMSHEHRRKAHCNHPDAFDWPLMEPQVRSLRSGQTIEMLVCDPTKDNRSRTRDCSYTVSA
ncbi:MAG: hypothetical protein K2Q97_00320 [Burkholderiaceae bacterium]|nr:hypothetical protein [Burkholderiaceae bacterium]